MKGSSPSLIPAHPEDQLKGPVQAFLSEAGSLYSLEVITKTESPVEGVGRPDIGVAVGGLLTGHIELKAPEKSIRPSSFKGADKKQWEKFKALPNLVYTNGSQWALYRSGVQEGKTVSFSENACDAGEKSFTAEQAQELELVFRSFLHWQPLSPSSPKALATTLAPLCRLLRQDVLVAVQSPASNIAQLAKEWREVLFPDADDNQFADAYAQTLTYALLLARFSNKDIDITTSNAAAAIRRGHALLSTALEILANPLARQEIELGVDLLERAIDAIDMTVLLKKHADPWIYFYEDFLAAYDPKLRKDRGVYYTPVEVIHAQTRLVSRLLQDNFDKPLSYADDGVVFLDPAAGTGSYPLVAIEQGLKLVEKQQGPGAVAGRASEIARNFNGFEVLIGPYAVSHLRVTEAIMAAGGTLPENGVHVYLTDTLEAPHAMGKAGQLTLQYKPLSDEHLRARDVKENVRVMVCMGNPPYDRQVIEPGREETEQRKGGWVRFGEDGQEGILDDFLKPVREAGQGVHAKNLYNDYVYFWRWALWKVFEKTREGGIVSFITASSYLLGPGFIGMRKVMRQLLDELWIIDLEGDNLGARKTENVFNIQTPVAIAVGVRYGKPKPARPAKVHYAKITGSREEKLNQLYAAGKFEDLDWKDCFAGWEEPLLPEGEGDYYSWPLMTDIFPWQYSGIQMKRTWVIGEIPELLKQRWKVLLSADQDLKRAAFRETGSRNISQSYPDVNNPGNVLTPIAELEENDTLVKPVSYGYRSFDRQWLIPDGRLGDRMRPPLWQSYSDKQIFMTSLLTGVVGLGPAATISANITDLHHFRGSFGGKDVIPLYRDSQADHPNITDGLLDKLSETYGSSVATEDLFAYAYALLASPAYVDSFSEELTIPGPRLPLTKDQSLFRQAAALGRKLIWLHTYGMRFVPAGKRAGELPQGQSRCTEAIPDTPDGYPEEFSYEPETRTLRVGDGVFAPVTKEIWEFSVSGLEVVKSWLSYRMKAGAGRKSSPLDEIRPERWTPAMTTELLELLWVLEATIDFYPEAESLLDAVIASDLFLSTELPEPSAEERKPPAVSSDSQLSLDK